MRTVSPGRCRDVRGTPRRGRANPAPWTSMACQRGGAGAPQGQLVPLRGPRGQLAPPLVIMTMIAGIAGATADPIGKESLPAYSDTLATLLDYATPALQGFVSLVAASASCMVHTSVVARGTPRPPISHHTPPQRPGAPPPGRMDDRWRLGTACQKSRAVCTRTPHTASLERGLWGRDRTVVTWPMAARTPTAASASPLPLSRQLRLRRALSPIPHPTPPAGAGPETADEHAPPARHRRVWP